MLGMHAVCPKGNESTSIIMWYKVDSELECTTPSVQSTTVCAIGMMHAPSQRATVNTDRVEVHYLVWYSIGDGMNSQAYNSLGTLF